MFWGSFQRAGIFKKIIFLFPDLTVADWLFLRSIQRAKLVFTDYRKAALFTIYQAHLKGSDNSTCSRFLSSDASFVVTAEEAVARSSFWRANFAILKGVALGNVIAVEHGRMRLSSTSMLGFRHVTPCLDAWHFCALQGWHHTVYFRCLYFTLDTLASVLFLCLGASLPFLPGKNTNGLPSFQGSH